VNQEEAACTYL